MEEHLFGEFALVHLTFGLYISPNATSPFTAVDGFQRLIFGNSQSLEKFTGKPRTQIKIYIYIAHHTSINEVNGIAQYLSRQQKHPYKATYQKMVSTWH